MTLLFRHGITYPKFGYDLNLDEFKCNRSSSISLGIVALLDNILKYSVNRCAKQGSSYFEIAIENCSGFIKSTVS